MKEKLASLKKFVEDHKTATAVTGTALVCLTINRIALRDHNNFLKEHNLYEKYYSAED